MIQKSKRLHSYFHPLLVWFGLIILTLGIIYMAEEYGITENINVSVLITYALIGLGSITGITLEIKKKRPYSLNLVCWIFTFLFFFLVPLSQYLTGGFSTQGSAFINTSDILRANLILIVWVLCYGIGYYLFSKRKGREFVNKPIQKSKLYITHFGIMFGLFLSLLSLFFFLKMFGLASLMTRASYGQALYETIEISPIRLIISNTLRAIPALTLAALLITKQAWKSRSQWWLFVIILVIFNLIINSPLGAPRYWSGSLLFGFLVLIFFKSCHSEIWVLLILIIGLVVISPIMGATRHMLTQEFSFQAFHPQTLIQVLISMDFDAYGMLIHIIQYVSEARSFFWGKQLIGSMLFWVPRNFWPNKPIGTGALVASEFGFSHINVSSPLPSEGYIDFGIAGVVVFAIGLGWLLSKLDCTYWKQSYARFTEGGKARIHFLALIYPFLLGFLVFILRGSLMSGMAYTIGFIIAGLPLIAHRPVK